MLQIKAFEQDDFLALLVRCGTREMCVRKSVHESCSASKRERVLFVDDLLVRIHLIIEMILVDRSCAMGV